MTNHINLHDRRQAGFTLVELAVVMIIIGLLIGGVLKGQQLIANAEIAATSTQVEGVDGAVSTFRDMYNGMPGDILANRIAGCAGSCNNNGDGNGRVGAANPFGAVSAGERLAFWGQMAAADVYAGIDTGGGVNFGEQLPSADVGGGFEVGYVDGTAALTAQQGNANNPRAGHYIALHLAPGAVPATGVITPQQAFMIDTKLDDGAPGQGSVLAAGAATCVNAAGGYNEANQAEDCNLYFRVQQ